MTLLKSYRRKVLVVGGGVGGLCAAVALRLEGFDVELFDAADSPRISGTGFGLGSNATKILRALGIDIAADGRGQVSTCFDVRRPSGKLIRSIPIQEISAELGSPQVTVTRGTLVAALVNALGDCTINLGSRFVRYRETGSGIEVQFEDGRVAHGEVLIGADGIHSAVRGQLVGVEDPVDHGYACWLATTTFAHPVMTAGYVSHYWGRGQRFGLADAGNGTAYWWGTKNVSPDFSYESVGRKDEVLRLFDGWADEISAVIGGTPEESMLVVPARDRVFLDEWGNGKVTLLGDAAHPMLASLGQGAGSAIEDGYVLAAALTHAPDFQSGLRLYERARLERTRMLVNSARKLSGVEQMENPVLCALRDLMFKVAPTRSIKRQNIAAMNFEFPDWISA